MNSSEWCIRFGLPECANLVFENVSKYHSHTVRFESENLASKDGFQSDILVGKMVRIDHQGKKIYSKSLLVKIFPEAFQKSSFTELTFQNEIFVYGKVIPFFATLNESVLHLFPNFYFARMDLLNDREEGMLVMENLTETGYRSTTSKTFLDIDHLILMVKKLGEFHAYSYQAKKQCPEKFFSLVDCLTETHFSVTKTVSNHLYPLNEYFFDILSKDARYANKVEKIRQLVQKVYEFLTKIFDTREEPIAVICHGDFLRNNAFFKYDAENKPVDVKFIDLGNMRYSNPIIDLGLVLYMNADQSVRDKYWDLLIQTYHDSLKNTFLDNDLIPSKEQVLKEFKHNVFHPYLLISVFVPWMMTMEENNSPSWFKDLFSPEYVEYQDKPTTAIPQDVLVNVVKKMIKPHREKKVLEALCDIIDRGFI